MRENIVLIDLDLSIIKSISQSKKINIEYLITEADSQKLIEIKKIYKIKNIISRAEFHEHTIKEKVEIYPDTVSNVGQLVSQYIRFPFTPKWTYVTLTNGEPAFDETAVDYQDFELPNDDEVNLVMKILQYAGMSIREIQAVQFAGSEEAQSEQQEK